MNGGEPETKVKIPPRDHQRKKDNKRKKLFAKKLFYTSQIQIRGQNNKENDKRDGLSGNTQKTENKFLINKFW